MQVSKRFLALVEQQLAQFADRPDLGSLVVYITMPGENGNPTLMAIGQWPARPGLPPEQATGFGGMAERQQGDGSSGEALSGSQRWLPLRDGALVLGALRVETDQWPWPAPLQERLNATARCLSEALRLDLEQQRLGQALAQRDDQLRLLVHQLRNPLAALRTFGQLLRRRLEGDTSNRSLVEQLLVEQGQISRYVEAIDLLAQAPALPAAEGATAPLLPPALSSSAPRSLSSILEPLLERAAATAALQGRRWQGPAVTPAWSGDGAAVAEIVANLLENAFRYSQPGQALGLIVTAADDGVALSIWDSGPAIPPAERERIFQRGERGSTGLHLPGTGLGLALGRQLARSLGGELELVVPPRALDPSDPELPDQGNAFRLWLPAEPPRAADSAQPQA
jgi:signal transduction histidine kinase